MKNLGNKALIEKIVENPRNEFAWREFSQRFHRYLCYTIYRVCKALDFSAGQCVIEDLAQDVYVQLLKDDCARLKGYVGNHKGSMYSYLAIAGTRTVYNKLIKRRAKKRIPSHLLTALDAMLFSAQRDKQFALHETLGAEDSNIQIQEFEDVMHHSLEILLGGKPTGKRSQLIFKLHYFKGLSAKEISDYPGINLGIKSVHNLLSRLKKDILRQIAVNL